MAILRSVFVITLVAALGLAVPASALDTVAEDDNGSGISKCQRILGRSACVAVQEGGCTLWVSAGWGGCFLR